MQSITKYALFLGMTVVAASPAHANQGTVPKQDMTIYAQTQFESWIAVDQVVEAIRAQNDRHENLDREEVVNLDNRWRAEMASGIHPMMDEVLGRPVSQYLLQQVKGTQGIVTEVILMDDRGLNVAQTAPTSDYWQGDEAKYQDTYLIGPDAVHVSDIEQGEVRQIYQAQVSLSIVDPADGSVIGAATISLNAEAFY